MLKDPSQRDQAKKVTLTSDRKELEVVPKPWAKSFKVHRFTIFNSLHVTNPTLRQVLSSWHKNYSKIRLINAEALLTCGEVIELTSFQNAIMKDIDSVKSLFLKK